MTLSPTSNAHKQLETLEDNTRYAVRFYNLNSMSDPSKDTTEWKNVIQDIEKLPDTPMKNAIGLLFDPYLRPRPADIRKCRKTLSMIEQNYGVLKNIIDSLSGKYEDVTHPVGFQSTLMTRLHVHEKNRQGPVMKIEKTCWPGKEYPSSTFLDLLREFDEHKAQQILVPKEDQEPTPLSLRVLQQAGTVVGYHVLKFQNKFHYNVAEVSRIGLDPQFAKQGLHLALMEDIVLSIANRFPLDTNLDSCLDDETLMPQIVVQTGNASA